MSWAVKPSLGLAVKAVVPRGPCCNDTGVSITGSMDAWIVGSLCSTLVNTELDRRLSYQPPKLFILDQQSNNPCYSRYEVGEQLADSPNREREINGL